MQVKFWHKVTFSYFIDQRLSELSIEKNKIEEKILEKNHYLEELAGEDIQLPKELGLIRDLISLKINQITTDIEDLTNKLAKIKKEETRLKTDLNSMDGK